MTLCELRCGVFLQAGAAIAILLRARFRAGPTAPIRNRPRNRFPRGAIPHAMRRGQDRLDGCERVAEEAARKAFRLNFQQEIRPDFYCCRYYFGRCLLRRAAASTDVCKRSTAIAATRECLV